MIKYGIFDKYIYIYIYKILVIFKIIAQNLYWFFWETSKF